MSRFDPERLQQALDVRSLTVKALAKAAKISPSTVQVARQGGEVSLRSQRAILMALSRIPELPHLELVANPAERVNGAKNDGAHHGGNLVGAGGSTSARASSTA